MDRLTNKLKRPGDTEHTAGVADRRMDGQMDGVEKEFFCGRANLMFYPFDVLLLSVFAIRLLSFCDPWRERFFKG